MLCTSDEVRFLTALVKWLGVLFIFLEEMSIYQAGCTCIRSHYISYDAEKSSINAISGNHAYP